MNKAGCGDGGTAAATHTTVAQRVIDMAYGIKDRAGVLNEKAGGKLHGITRCSMPSCTDEKQLQEDWPQYFSELREILGAINHSLDGIDDTIERVEF